ncbi:MAG: secretin N-terminal domain-containing protein [Steroidobacteraceae bacterium]
MLSATMAGCASDRLHHEGLKDVEAGQYESGTGKLEEAMHGDPGNLTYRLDYRGRKEEAIQALIATADRARNAGRLDEAEAAYRRVLAIDAGNGRAQAGIEQLGADRRHAQVIASARKDIEQGRLDNAEAALRTVLAEDPGSAAANALRAQVDAARGPRNVTPRLKTRDGRAITLQFREANTKMVFEVLSRQTGINFIFDKDVRADGKTTIFVQQVPVEQAIALILGQNQLSVQVLAENMALVYPSTAAKQKEYQDNIVRTFYLTNADPKKVMELMKSVLGAKTVFVDERVNVLVMRDTPDAVRMAERLIASVDLPEAEVMLEVEVLEISRTRMQKLGLNFPTGVKFSPTPLAGDPLVLADLGDQDSTTITVSDVPVTLDLKKEVGVSNLLASPRIRARNREKAKVLIGQRVPVITNTVTPTTSQPVVTGSVQYLDVGLTLEVEPTVHLDGDVAIKINLEVSSILQQVTADNSGTIAYQIGTRNATTLLQLRDGETQILAGLINDNDRKSSSHVPGLGDMPLIGRLFGSRLGNSEKNEIVLSITPRIVRAQPRASSENAEFYYGTEAQLRGTPLANGAPAAVGSGAARAPVVPETVESPISAEGAAAPEPDAEAEAESDTPDARARPNLRLDGEPQVAVGEEFSVTLHADNATGFRSLRSMLRFDPSVLQFLGGAAGELVPPDQREAAEPRAEVGGGRVRFEVAGGSVSGSGALVILKFRALAPRPQTMIAVQQFAAVLEKGEPVSIMAPRPLVLAVTP